MKKDLLWDSIKEVFWLAFIAFLPLIISIFYQTIKLESINLAYDNTLHHPSEILAFCLSFLAPSIFFIKKSHGKNYKLPFLDLFFFSTIAMYIIALIFVFIIKNNVDPQFIENIKGYTKYSVIFLIVTIIYRIYSSYHQSNSSNYFENKKSEEDDFNSNFKKMINAK